MTSESKKLQLRKDYLTKNPCTCTKTSFFHLSFPYCSEGYVCSSHCSLWFKMYSIDFDRLHRDDPNNISITQLTLF